MDKKIELAPVFGDSLKYGFHLSGHIYIQRHQYWGLELKGERPHILLRFFVEVGHRELGSERSESLRAAPSNRIFIRNPDNKASLAFQKLGLRGRPKARQLMGCSRVTRRGHTR